MTGKKGTLGELPLGLGMALAMDTAAMERFAALDAQAREALIDEAKAVSSKNEMQALVRRELG